MGFNSAFKGLTCIGQVIVKTTVNSRANLLKKFFEIFGFKKWIAFCGVLLRLIFQQVYPLYTPCPVSLTLIMLTWRIWRALNNASRWQMGFNSALKGLIAVFVISNENMKNSLP